MRWTARPRFRSIFLFLALLQFLSLTALATVPPAYVELTKAEMKKMGFTVTMNKHDDTSWIELKFPEQMQMRGFWLVPQSTNVVIKHKDGDVMASTTNWIAKNDVRTIVSSYQHTHADSSVSIVYGCPKTGADGCYGAATLRISSVSTFFEENPESVDLPLNCVSVPNAGLEIRDCTQ